MKIKSSIAITARVDFLILKIKNAVFNPSWKLGNLFFYNNLQVKNKISTIFPSAGNRNNNDGSMNNQGSNGNVWSSSVDGKYSHYLNFNSDNANKNNNNRANGHSVRCLKDYITYIYDTIYVYICTYIKGVSYVRTKYITSSKSIYKTFI